MTVVVAWKIGIVEAVRPFSGICYYAENVSWK